MPADSTLTVTLTRDRWWTAFVGAWAVLAVAVPTAWALSLHAAGHPTWPFLLPLLAALQAAWLVRREWRAREAVLRWDERQGWSLDRGLGAAAGAVRIALDFDRWLLLEVVSGGRSVAWLAASAGGLPPGRWHALRCALVRGPATEVPA